MTDTVEITKSEYESLLQQSEWLECLEAAGVDNWQGIEVAYDLYNEEDNCNN